MKKAIKNWLFKEELQELKELKENFKNYPTHDEVGDFTHGVIYDGNYVTESDIEEKFEDVIYGSDMWSQLQENDVAFANDIEHFVSEDDLDHLISDAVDAMEWSEIIGEEVNRVFNARAEEVVKQVLKDIPGYFMYEQIKRYVEEDYVSFSHFSLNFDDLASTVMMLEDKMKTGDQAINDRVFLTKLKLALHTLVVEHTEHAENNEG